MSELTDWVNRVGPVAARMNEEARQENEREAAKWLAAMRDRFLGLDTTRLSIEQLGVVKKLADTMVGRLYAEIWGRETGIAVPEYGSSEWEAFYDHWLESN